MRVLAQVLIAIWLGLAIGCRKTPDASEFFRPWGCDNAADLRERFDQFKNVLVVHVTESRWEDRGPHALTPYHFKATVSRSYKGAWSAGEKLDFVHYLDSPAPTNVPLTIHRDDLYFIMTNEHTNAEITVETGDFAGLNSELEPALHVLFPQ